MQSVFIIISYGIAALSIILGFIALLAQRIYIDTNTQKPTEIKIPIVGKMRTNYPALVFLIVGLAFAFIAVRQSSPPQKIPKIPWTITGSFNTVDGKDVDWPKGTLIIFPADFEPQISKTGNFTIKAFIEEGKTFEDVIERIDYSHDRGSKIIYPKKEYAAYKKGEKTLIKNETKTTREYKPVPVTIFPPKEN